MTITRFEAQRRAALSARQRRMQALQRRQVTIAQTYGELGISCRAAAERITMIVSPWFRDPADGCMTRTVRASD